MVSLIVGLIIGTGVLALVMWLRNNSVATKWYDWVIGAVGLLLVLFAMQNFGGSQAEYQPIAANLFLLMNGLPGIILLAVAGILFWRRQRTAG